MNILVIFTGGTIGSSMQDGFIAPKDDNKFKLIQMYKESTGDSQKFTVVTPYTILSENLNGRYITKLMECINIHMQERKYDGIIVLHGTDTLHYMAAGLSIVFAKTEIPLILVSSNYPLEDQRANGLYNFIHAVKYIQKRDEPGVYVSYKNRNEEEKIFMADRIVNYDIYSDTIRAIEEKKISSEWLLEKEGLHGIANIKVPMLKEISPIKFIRPYPGIQYEIPKYEVKAVLLGTYHSGTINTADNELKKFCEAMKEREIHVYICGVPDGVGYESTKHYKALGIKVLPYGTDIYWYMKLWIEYSK